MKPRDRTRVAVVIPRYYPVFGGAENQCRLLNQRLLMTGNIEIPFVLTKRIEKGLARQEYIDGVQVRRIGHPGLNRWGEYYFYARALIHLVMYREHYDVIHGHASSIFGFFVAMAGVIAGRPVILKLSTNGELVVGLRSHEGLAGPAAGMLGPVRRLLARWTAGHAHFVALNREGLQELLQAKATNPVLIPNGIDTNVFKPLSTAERMRLRAAHGFRAEDIVFLYAGRFVRRKGLDLLLESINGLLRSNPAFKDRLRLCLAGSDHLQQDSCAEYIEDARKSFPDNIYVLPPVIPPIAYFQIADVLVFPSRREGMPNAVLEAVATGVPCLLSDIAPHRELARQNARARLTLFPSDAAPALQEALANLIHGIPPLATVPALSEEFRIENVARRYAALYREALGRV